MLTQDAADFKRATRMADLVPGLKKSSHYLIGPCPFCGGRDRFNVKTADNGDLWICRQCGDGKYHDVIDFLVRRDGKTFNEIIGQSAAPRPAARATPTPSPVPELSQPPAEDWQMAALVAAAECANRLHSSNGTAALDYLHTDRKLIDVTIHDHMIGFNPKGYNLEDGSYFPRGITIPCMVDGALWYVKVRMTPNDVKRAEARGDKKINKYLLLSGSHPGALFHGDRLIGARSVFVVEGEFDAMVLGQYTSAAVVTMGSAGSLPSNRWLAYFAAARDVILLLDDDDAGRQALARWNKKIPRARLAALPWGIDGQPARGETNGKKDKDVTDFRRNGGNLVTWSAAVLRGEEIA